MHSRTGHLTGALIGLAGAFVVGYLLLRSAAQLNFVALLYASSPHGLPADISLPSGALTVHGSVSAASMLLLIAVITGLMVSSRRVSPFAPLLAGLALLAVGLTGHFDYWQLLPWMFRNLPASLKIGAASAPLFASGIWQLLGGIMLVSAAMPWRWTGKLAPAGPNRTAVGVLIGVFGIAGLWYLLQFANPVGYEFVTGRTGLPRVFDLILLVQAAAATVIGLLAAARWVSPVAAVISGTPLLAVGLLLVIAPVGSAGWTAPLVWGGQPLSVADPQSLSMGALVLFGGLLVVAAVAPGRWRRQSSPPVSAQAIVLEAS